MYVKYKKNNRNPKLKRIYHYLYVILAHVFVLLLVFYIFCFKGCKVEKKPTSIKINLINPASVQNNSAKINNEPIQQKIPKSKKIKKPIVTKKKIKKSKLLKKKWKALDPSQITKSITKKVKKKSPQKSKPVVIDTSAFKSNLSKNIKQIKYKNSFAEHSSIISYYDEVSQYLYQRWEQPGRSVINGDFPSVEVKFFINKEGTILKSSIVKQSGIATMDSSVKQLLSNITRLPKPPDGARSFSVFLEYRLD